MATESSFNGFVVTSEDVPTEEDAESSQGDEMQNTVVAAETLLAYRLVVPTPSGLVLADPEEPEHRFRILGMTTTGVASGAIPSLQTNGFIQNPTEGVGAWNLVVGAPVYLAAGGVITSVYSDNAIAIGRAAAANAIVLNPSLYTNPVVEGKQSVTASTASTAIDLKNGSMCVLLLNVNTTVTLSNAQGNEDITLLLTATENIDLSFANVILPVGVASPYAVTRDTLMRLRYDASEEEYRLISVTQYGSAYEGG